MPEAADIPGRLDAFMNAAVRELRAEITGAEGNTIVNADSIDDLAADNLLDTHSAASRFGYPADSIRKWCREENLGVRRGGRWLVDPRKLRARINGRE